MVLSTAAIQLFALMAVIIPYTSAEISLNLLVTLPDYLVPYWNGIILPSTLISSACATTWARPLSCSEWLLKFQGASLVETEVFTLGIFNQKCVGGCIGGLRDWRDDLRADYTAKDIASVNSPDYNPAWDGSEGGQQGLVVFLDPALFTVEVWFFDTCLKDLSSGRFCYLLPENDPFSQAVYETDPNSRAAAAFCNSTCSTQMSLFILEVASKGMGLDSGDGFGIGDARILCPGLDTSRYPFLGSSSPSTSSPSTSSSPYNTGNGSSQSTSSAGPPNQTNSNSTTVLDENAALSLKVVSSVWGFGSTLVAVALGILFL